MTDQDDQRSTFQLLDEGTMFTGRYFWNDEHNVLHCAVGVWPMADVSSVTTFPDTTLPDMPGPRCCLVILGGYLYLQAHFSEVQKAWRQYRRQEPVRRPLPFSGIFPFSGN